MAEPAEVFSMLDAKARKITQTESVKVDSHGGGGDDGGMEARLSEVEKAIIRLDARGERTDGRLASLEADMREVRSGVSDLKVTVGEINSKFDISSIRANVEKAHTDIYKWIATVVVLILSGLALLGWQRLTQIVMTPPGQSAPATPGVQPAPAQPGK